MATVVVICLSGWSSAYRWFNFSDYWKGKKLKDCKWSWARCICGHCSKLVYVRDLIAVRVMATEVVVAVVSAAVVTMALTVVVVLSLETIPCLQTVQFLCLLKRHNGWMDGQMVRWTDRPTYKNARTHLKCWIKVWKMSKDTSLGCLPACGYLF